MIEPIARFLVGNVGASVLGGLWAAAVVLAAIQLFGISRAVTRNRLWAVPLIKSSLVLLGLCTVMPFPTGMWRSLQANAIGFDMTGPVFFLILGAFVLASPIVRSRARSRLLSRSEPVRDDERVTGLLQGVMDGFDKARGLECAGFTLGRPLPRPEIFKTRARSTVAIIDGNRPVLLVPASLADELDDEELEAVLAHEVAHLALRRPRGCCDPQWLRRASWLNPASWAASRLMANEEELACDELAARVTGKPEALAGALLKAYRFDKGEGRPLASLGTARLLEKKGLLQRRIQRLTEGAVVEASETPVRLCLAWSFVLILAFATT